jgi:tetratricopeptide (TPR) repeat protein
MVPEDPGGQQGFGAPFVMLWLLVAAAWLLGQLRQGTLHVHLGWPDAVVVALVAWHSASALVAIGSGSPRPALNMLWDWVSMGLGYLLARQLVRTTAEIKAVLVVMIGLACGLSLLAVHQSLVTLPDARATYESIKDSTEALYEQTGQWMPPGSSVRRQFESRLDSSLATATFALSNSLAGFLVPWIVVLGGVLFSLWQPSPDPSLKGRGIDWGRWATIAVGLLVIALFAWCLVLTGSRAAGIAALFGLLLASIPVVRTVVWPRKWLRASLFVVAVVAIIGGAIVANSSPGRAALAAAWRSVVVRIEYWQATAAMIADAPWFGCGPGQFQDIYTAFKLPEAVEEVQDPHNWLLEVWSTAGTPAAVALLIFLGFVVVRVMRGSCALTEPIDSALDGGTARAASLIGGLIGLALGVVLASWTGFTTPGTQVLLLVAGMVGIWWVLGAWYRAGPLPPRLPLVAAVALFLNLSAAGGIGFPGVAESLWLLLAVQLNLWEPAELSARARSPDVKSSRSPRQARRAGWAACLALLAILAAALWTEYLPVMGCRWRLNLADLAMARGRADESRAAFEEALEADPWSAVAAQRLAVQRFVDYQTLPTDTQLKGFTEAETLALQLAPHRSNAWAESAEYREAIYRTTNDVEDLRAAESRWRQAIELYPTEARLHARLATLLAQADRSEEAYAAASEALRLDEVMHAAGHHDQLLDPALRRQLESIVDR